MAAKGKNPRRSRAKTGRPTLLLDRVRRTAVLDAIRAGASFTDACLAAGVGYTTFKSWRRQARLDAAAGKATAFTAFRADVKKAAAQFVTANTQAIQEHGQKSWQARAWLLERRRPDLFGDQRAEVRRLTRLVEDLLRQIAALRAADPSAGSPGEPARLP
jgi:transposase-like protein